MYSRLSAMRGMDSNNTEVVMKYLVGKAVVIMIAGLALTDSSAQSARRPRPVCGEGGLICDPVSIPCRISGCEIPVTCNRATSCRNKVNSFVHANVISGTRSQRRIAFTATATANVPSFETVRIKPSLTRRGRIVARANRNKTVMGVLVITNATTGSFVSSTPIRIKVR